MGQLEKCKKTEEQLDKLSKFVCAILSKIHRCNDADIYTLLKNTTEKYDSEADKIGMRFVPYQLENIESDIDTGKAIKS